MTPKEAREFLIAGKKGKVRVEGSIDLRGAKIEILSANQYAGATIEKGLQASQNLLNRFPGGGKRAQDEAVHLALILRLDPFVGIETAGRRLAVRNLSGDLAAQIRGVEGLDCRNTGLAIDQAAPAMLDAHSQRTDQS